MKSIQQSIYLAPHDGPNVPDSIREEQKQKKTENLKGDPIKNMTRLRRRDMPATSPPCAASLSPVLRKNRSPVNPNRVKNQKMRCKIKGLKYDVKLLAKEILSIEEEVELQLANFAYILELVAQNITKQVAKKMSIILSQKNETIKKQLQTIINLEQQKLEIMTHQEEQKNLRIYIAEANQKINSLENQNRSLKEENTALRGELARVSSTPDNGTKAISLSLKKTSSSSTKMITPIAEEDEFPPCEAAQPIRGTRIKKRNTMMEEVCWPSKGEPDELEVQIRSLGSLKQKINKLKVELEQVHI